MTFFKIASHIQPLTTSHENCEDFISYHNLTLTPEFQTFELTDEHHLKIKEKAVDWKENKTKTC